MSHIYETDKLIYNLIDISVIKCKNNIISMHFIPIFQQKRKQMKFMQTFSVMESFATVAPMVIIIGIGFLLGQTKILGPDFVREENRLNYHIGFPLLLFCSTATADLRTLFDWKLVAYALTSVLLIAAASYFFFGKITDSRKQGALTTTAFRSDILLFAVYISNRLYGESGIALAAMLTAFISPTVTILSILILDRLDDTSDHSLSFSDTIKRVMKNPFVITVLIGILYNYSGLPFPSVIQKPLSDIGSVAIPLSLLSIGVQSDFRSMAKDRGLLALGVLTRLAAVPVIFLSGAVLLGFRGSSLCCLFAQYAAPAATSCYTFARQMNSDSSLTGSIVVFSTLFSAATIFAGLLILTAFKLL